MDRKPVWINGRQVFVLPWARVWDVLMAAPSEDLLAVWTGRAIVVDGQHRTMYPDDGVLSGQKLFIRRRNRLDRPDFPAAFGEESLEQPA